MKTTKTMLKAVKGMDKDVRLSRNNLRMRGMDDTLAQAQLDRICKVRYYLTYRLTRND